MSNFKYENEEQWDELVSDSIEVANERLHTPFEGMEFYAFQKGFEACADDLKKVLQDHPADKEEVGS